MNVSDPVAATDPGVATRAATPVPTTVGKLYFTEPDGSDHSCSGATINSDAKNLIHTAAHCVYTYGAGWNVNIVFVPAYFNGSRPFGTWNYSLARTFNAWINSQDYTHDQAFVSFYPVSGVQLVNRVGGNGLSINNGPRMAGVRIWGYPADPPYTGQLPYYCDGDTSLYGLITQTQMPCDMTGGASGGPWLSSRINVDLGYVYAVTSRRTLSGVPSLISTPDGEDVLSMFNEMG
jgi:V8-like Glu-specific endopeptidase